MKVIILRETLSVTIYIILFSGLNSRINRNIMVKHPNSDVLVCFIKDEFMKAEMDVKKVQQGLKVKTVGQAKYRRLEDQRETLQKMYAKGDLGEDDLKYKIKNKDSVIYCLSVILTRSFVNVMTR